jgi:hypothetical protein
MLTAGEFCNRDVVIATRAEGPDIQTTILRARVRVTQDLRGGPLRDAIRGSEWLGGCTVRLTWR